MINSRCTTYLSCKYRNAICCPGWSWYQPHDLSVSLCQPESQVVMMPPKVGRSCNLTSWKLIYNFTKVYMIWYIYIYNIIYYIIIYIYIFISHDVFPIWLKFSKPPWRLWARSVGVIAGLVALARLLQAMNFFPWLNDGFPAGFFPWHHPAGGIGFLWISWSIHL